MVSRGQRQRDDRRVRRVHLGVGRRIGKIARQRRAGGVDRRLHVLRGAVDVAVEVELQRDLADAERARRGHHRQRRDLAELPLQRRRHQRGDGVGAGAGKLGGDLDGRKVDLRQRRHRQTTSSRASRPAWSRSQQRSRDRPPDERRRDAHSCASFDDDVANACRGRSACRPPVAPRRGHRLAAGRPAPARRWSPPPRLPAVSRAKPVVTTRSPASGRSRSPPGSQSCCDTVTGRTATVLSGCTTKTKMPFGPRCTAAVGATTTCFSVSISSRTLTNWPGQSCRSLVRELGLELDRAGGLVDLVVDHLELAAVDHRLVVGAEHFDRQGAPFGHRAVDVAELLLRQGEQHRDRLQLRDARRCRSRPSARTMLPSSTWRMPVRPSSGATMVV